MIGNLPALEAHRAQQPTASEIIDLALRLMREPMTLDDARTARTVLTNFAVEQKKQARRALKATGDAR
jgi:hypothetical protein